MPHSPDCSREPSGRPLVLPSWRVICAADQDLRSSLSGTLFLQQKGLRQSVGPCWMAGNGQVFAPLLGGSLVEVAPAPGEVQPSAGSSSYPLRWWLAPAERPRSLFESWQRHQQPNHCPPVEQLLAQTWTGEAWELVCKLFQSFPRQDFLGFQSRPCCWLSQKP